MFVKTKELCTINKELCTKNKELCIQNDDFISNPIHTDMIGNSWEYPEANYSRRKEIWQEHVDYTNGFLWFMSSDPGDWTSSQPQLDFKGYRVRDYLCL